MEDIFFDSMPILMEEITRWVEDNPGCVILSCDREGFFGWALVPKELPGESAEEWLERNYTYTISCANYFLWAKEQREKVPETDLTTDVARVQLAAIFSGLSR